MTESTRIHERFEFYLEDLDCIYCLYANGRRSKNQENGCGEHRCRYEDYKRTAIANGRIKRKEEDELEIGNC